LLCCCCIFYGIRKGKCLCSWQFLSGFCHYDNNGRVWKKNPLSHIYAMDKLKFWLKFDTIVFFRQTLSLLILFLLLYSAEYEYLPISHTLFDIFIKIPFCLTLMPHSIAFTQLWKYKIDILLIFLYYLSHSCTHIHIDAMSAIYYRWSSV
jgi:hypothetical protein